MNLSSMSPQSLQPPAVQPRLSTHSQPGKPGAQAGASVCGKASDRQVSPGRHSLNDAPPSGRSRTGVQMGEHTSGAGMVDGSTLGTQAEPGWQAMPADLQPPWTQISPEVSRPAPWVDPLTSAMQALNTGEVQSACWLHD